MAEEELAQQAEQQQEVQAGEQVSEEEAQVEQVEQTEKEKPEKKKKQTAQERIDELTYRVREGERRETEKDEQTNLLLGQNKKLLERFDTFEGRFEDEREPDRFDNPQEHDDWLLRKAKREILKEVGPQKAEEPQKAEPVINQKITPERLQTFEAAMSTVHDDYYEVAEEAKKDMANDPMLRSEIWQSDNPPKKAYDYIIKKRERATQQRDAGLDTNYVEGGGPPQEPQPIQLTAEQKDIANKMGISQKDYIKQLDIIEGR